jgi:hypothetical protein
MLLSYLPLFLQDNVMKATKQTLARRRKPLRPKPKEQEGMPHHQQCLHAKRREDRNPKYHEEEHKYVACILAAHPPKKMLLSYWYNATPMRYIDVMNCLYVHGVTSEPSHL